MTGPQGVATNYAKFHSVILSAIMSFLCPYCSYNSVWYGVLSQPFVGPVVNRVYS